MRNAGYIYILLRKEILYLKTYKILLRFLMNTLFYASLFADKKIKLN